MEETSNGSRVKKALKRLENFEVKVHIRGGDVKKIPAQEGRLQERDGIVLSFEIPADISDD